MSATMAIALLATQAPTVLAAVGDNGDVTDGKKATNKVEIEFEENDGSTKPVDPENPEKPVDPEIPGEETGNKGPLSIDLVSNYRFGAVKISGNDNNYFAKPTRVAPTGTTNFEDRANYVQVTDNRGTSAGWKLQVEQKTPLKHTSGSTIIGTKLSLLNGVSNSVYISDTNTPTPGSNVLIQSGEGLVDVATAQVDHGIGTWTHAFGKDAVEGAKSVKLFIPGNQKIAKGGYETKLFWTLVDAPN